MAVLLIVEDDTATNEAICEYMSSEGIRFCLPSMESMACRSQGKNPLI